VLSGIDDFYRGGKQLLATYAPLAFEAYQSGDAVAANILHRNLSAIATLIEGGAKHLTEKTVTVSLCGGLTKQEAILLPILHTLLANTERTYEIEICRRVPVWGALRLAGMPKKEFC
jgi:N-acetylglucosamine kinase-like BadF-type ATPase